MPESKMFKLGDVLTVDDIAAAVETFLRTEKAMDVQSSKTTDGYAIQGSQKADGWKTISGTRLAITCQLIISGDSMTAMIGEGQWSDKIGAGALGMFVAWPLAVSAGFGALQQKKLPSQIFDVIDKTILANGRQISVNGAGATIGENDIVCPSCKTLNSTDSTFCKSCGAKLKIECPKCGAQLEPGSAFCNKCGEKIDS